jgi:hypothetical protein
VAGNWFIKQLEANVLAIIETLFAMAINVIAC